MVEKILGRDERLPEAWPVAGTTGYDFLNAVNGIFVHPEGLERLEEIYARRSPATTCPSPNSAIDAAKK